MAQNEEVRSCEIGGKVMTVMVLDLQDGKAFVQELGNEDGEIFEVDVSALGPVV